MKSARIALAAGVVFAASIVLSLVHPWGDVRSGVQAHTAILDGSNVPAEVQQVLEMKCADCHSNNTRWPAYSRLAPGSWLMERDVHEGREHLNLSRWQQYNLESRIDLLAKIASEARSGEMPVKQYLLLHPKARLSEFEQQLIYDWAKSERKRMKSQAAKQQDESLTK
jgi:cytochrome c